LHHSTPLYFLLPLSSSKFNAVSLQERRPKKEKRRSDEFELFRSIFNLSIGKDNLTEQWLLNICYLHKKVEYTYLLSAYKGWI